MFILHSGDKARLISETIKRNPNGICVNFWYHAYGASIGTLNIYTRIRSQLSSNPIWVISGNQGNLWRTSSVTIHSNEDFQVIFLNIFNIKILKYTKFKF
jgi:hypothetical protein